MNYNEMISDVKVYGLEESIRASKYPMIVDVNKATTEVVDRTISLAQAPKGSGHDNFLKGINVQFDLTMTPKMSVECERYHFIDFVSSQSTMHKITKFDLDKAYIKYVDKRVIEVMKEKVVEYNTLIDTKASKEETDEKYLEILYTNPCGFRLTSRMTTNYQQLKTIYSQRKTHRLPEWRAFCEWIETLPYANEFIIGGKN
jgi:hypothetical protein